MARDEDVQYVEAARSGNPEAFGELVDKYERSLFNAAYRITGSREDAMDATQAAFAKAYEKLHTYKSAFRFFSWIYRITVNESLDLVTARGRQPASDLPADFPASASSPEEAYRKLETGHRVHRALMHLPADYRVAVVLRHFHGLSYREMSEVIGVPEKTVKSRLFSARQRLMALLRAQGLGIGEERLGELPRPRRRRRHAAK